MRKLVQENQEKTIFLFLTGYVFLINYMQIFAHQQISYLYPLFLMLNILIFFYYVVVLNKNKEMGIPRIRWIEGIFWLLIFSIDLSKLYHMEYNLVLLTYIIFGKLIPRNTDKKQLNQLIQANLISISPFLVYAIYSFNHYPSYYNNSMGVLLSINSYFILTLISKTLQKKQKKESLLLSLYLLINLVTTYNTGSRTAILASILLVSYFIYYLIKTMHYISRDKLIWASPGLVGLMYIGRSQLVNLFKNLFYKWDGNGLDFSFTGRTGIWAYTLKNYEIFGGGSKFFIKELDVFHGHNIIFNMLGFYGVIPFIMVLIIILYGLYIFMKMDNLNIRLFTILFIVINTFEGVIGGPEYSYFQLLFFLHFGFLMEYLNNSASSQPCNSESFGKWYERV